MSIAVGAKVRTKARTAGHTRLPRYLERCPGVIVASLGSYVFPDAYVRDSSSAKRSELFTVAFDAQAVFPEAGAGMICADLFADYLEEER